MKIEKRQLYRDDEPNGYLESDREFHDKNRELINSILEPDVSDKNKTLELIDFLSNKIDMIAVNLIESEARKVLSTHSNSLQEFIMAMGSAFFTNRLGDVISYGQLKYLKSIEDMINKLNTDHNICGIPMRFTASGKRNSNW